MRYTTRTNVNRGFMKLQVWQEAIDLLQVIKTIVTKESGIDIRLRSQILGAAQSISANIAEGYCRRTVREYIQFVGIALGSSGELFSRIVGLRELYDLAPALFEEFDRSHYSLENKLLGLRKALESKRRDGSWEEELREPRGNYRVSQE